MFEDFPGYLVGKFLSLGLFIGESVIRFLEHYFPQFSDKQPELFKNDYYLRDSGLSKKERLKRNIKTGIIVYFVFVFFVIAVVLLVFPRAILGAVFTSRSRRRPSGQARTISTFRWVSPSLAERSSG